MSTSITNTVHEAPHSTEDSPPQVLTSDTAPLDTRPSSLKRHSEELWFDDGNVILAARDVGFRVFRSDAEEIVEGCPVVHISDTPEDVTHFLRALLPTSQRIFFSRTFNFTFHQVSAVIRLAHKYNVRAILDQAAASLQDHFTTNFDAWNSGDNRNVIHVEPQQAIGVINLARLVDRPSLLPTAFYTCALLGSRVLDGYEHEDKSIEHLVQQDIKRCIDGRNKLVEETFAVILEVFHSNPCGKCKNGSYCKPPLQRMLENAVKACKTSSVSVLQGWEIVIRQWAKELRLCNLCEKEMIEHEYKARKRVWDALPDIFDIEVDGWGPSDGGEDGNSTAAIAGRGA